MILMDAELAAKLKVFVEHGGTLVMSAHTAVKDRDNTMTDQTIPIMGLRDLFGVEVDSFECYQPPSRDRNALKFADGASLPVHVFAESLKPLGAILKSANYNFIFPDDTTTKVIRRGTLFCQPSGAECSFIMVGPEFITSVN